MLFLYLNHNTLHLLGNTFSVLWFKFNPFSSEDLNNNKIFSKNMAAFKIVAPGLATRLDIYVLLNDSYD